MWRVVLLLAFVVGTWETRADDSEALCSNRGWRNETTGNCNCINGFFGWKCQNKYCPHGTSWHSKPLVSHKRNIERVPCSNAGNCDLDTGKCTCRPGYEGRACERMSCPTRRQIRFAQEFDEFYSNRVYDSNNVEPFHTNINIGVSGDTQNTPPGMDPMQGNKIWKAGAVPGLDPPCSGHGRCRTMYEAGTMWDGLTVQHPPVYYDSWEADKIQGCLCDPGWEGFDCSLRKCPWGRDPLDTSAAATGTTLKNEEYVISCQADAGYFAIDIMGGTTGPIPFDADPIFLKHMLEGVRGVGSVDVVMEEAPDGLPAVCHAAAAGLTTFTLLEHPGQLAPARINTVLAASRAQPASATALALTTGSGVISFISQYRLTCNACVNCHGQVRFRYGRSITDAISVAATGAATAIDTAVTGLFTASNAGWVDLSVTVTIPDDGTDNADKICSGADNTVHIDISSQYGNIPGLMLVDGSYREDLTYIEKGFGGESLNVTLSSNSGNGELYECSNQGSCDRSTGVCVCHAIEDFTVRDRHVTLSKSAASDTLGGAGTRGDCGYMEHNLGCRTEDASACSGQGTCAGGKCRCFTGFSGMDCRLRDCPVGTAWFDQPTSASTAHEQATCSNRGFCNRKTGICACQAGFTGAACDVQECPLDGEGRYCSGHGYCKSVNEIFRLYGLEYGHHLHPDLNNLQTWDGNMFHECICAANYAGGEYGHPLKTPEDPRDRPTIAAMGARPVPGWTGFSCNHRLCPRGDTNMEENNERNGLVQKEEQRVICSMGSTPTEGFKITHYGQTTNLIAASSNAAEIKRVIEAINTVGNVTVTIEHISGTACNAAQTSGTGVVISFDTEGGNHPNMVVESTTGIDVSVEGVTDGTSANLECGGPNQGMCDRRTGICECKSNRYSSDGENKMGANGDCSYRPDHLPY